MTSLHTKRLVLAAALSCWVASSGCALLVAGAAGGAAAGAAASAKDGRSDYRRAEDHGAMTYVGTIFANVVYVPAKIVFAGAGAATSGVTYIVTFGDEETTDSVWNASVGGNYVLTPAMIAGEESIHFVG